MTLLAKPYFEEGLSISQQILRKNGQELISQAIVESKFLSDKTEALGFSDNGISAVISFVHHARTAYALKIKPVNQHIEHEVLQLLEDQHFSYALRVFEIFEFSFKGVICSCTVLEYFPGNRASHEDLSEKELLNLFKELGTTLAKLHQIPISQLQVSEGIDGKSMEQFGNAPLVKHFEEQEKVICHHALGLHNVLVNELREFRIIDFKTQLLPVEFDLAMFIIWNRWKGEKLIEAFKGQYLKERAFSEDLLIEHYI